jgi:glycosyltransferase involved in cell wall biosynthesis
MSRCVGWSAVRPLLRDCDLIHSVGAATAGVLASAWGRRAGVRHVTQVSGSDVNSILPRTHASPGVAGWEAGLHGVACNSRALADAFLALYPRCRNVCIAYRGVDLERFHPVGAGVESARDDGGCRYLFLGGFPLYPRIFPHGVNTKGGETLLAAWQAAEGELASAGASLRLEGPNSLADATIRWRASLQHPDRVQLAGLVPPESIPAQIRSSDVVLVPSMEEGLPNTAMEASASGRPVFGSNVGGIPEVVAHGETGLILPPGDVSAWKQALVENACRRSELAEMGRCARRRMEQLFDCRRYAPQMLDLYHRALDEPLQVRGADDVWYRRLYRLAVG